MLKHTFTEQLRSGKIVLSYWDASNLVLQLERIWILRRLTWRGKVTFVNATSVEGISLRDAGIKEELKPATRSIALSTKTERRFWR